MDDPAKAEAWWADLSGAEFAALGDRIDDAIKELDARARDRTLLAQKSARLRRTLYTTKSSPDSRGESSQGAVLSEPSNKKDDRPAWMRRMAGKPPKELNLEEAGYIRGAIRDGYKIEWVMAWWGVSRKTVKDIIAGKTWVEPPTDWVQSQPYALLPEADRPTPEQIRAAFGEP